MGLENRPSNTQGVVSRAANKISCIGNHAFHLRSKWL